jgi:tRNA pseudouridine55 synthase
MEEIMEDKRGIIVISKEKGITSTRVVEMVRKLFRVKKAGHLGTLDPMATGVLPIAIGKATKLADVLMGMEKEYIVTVKLGILTDTYDIEGKVLKEEVPPLLGEDRIREVLKEFTGEILQVPPMYSAKRYKGKRLYELAREGMEIEREPKKVYIGEIELLRYDHPFILLRVVCGKGVYIRSLAKDVAERLGTIGVVWDLERIRVCGFDKSSAVSLEDIKALDIEEREKLIIPLEDVLKMLPSIKVFGKLKWWVLSGNDVVISPDEVGRNVREGDYIVIGDEEGKVIALGIVKSDRSGYKVHPFKVLN